MGYGRGNGRKRWYKGDRRYPSGMLQSIDQEPEIASFLKALGNRGKDVEGLEVNFESYLCQ